MRRPSQVLGALVLVILAVRPVLAGTITGVVTDPDGRPVPGARVLVTSALAVTGTATTDASGSFRIERVADGTYEVRVALDGFRANTETIAVSGDEERRVALRLELSAVVESVVVSAAQVDVPLSRTTDSVTVLTGEELRTRQVETVADALRLVPGLSVVRNGGRGGLTSLLPRGGESDFTLVLVDGVRVNAFGGGFDFSQLSMAGVDRIEVVRGAQSALFGSDAIGAVVQVVTRHGGSPRAEGAFEGGSFGTTRAEASASGSRGAWSWGSAAERSASDGFTGIAPATGERVSNDDAELWRMAGNGAWHSGGGAELRADGSYSRRERGFPGPFGSNPIGAYEGVDTVSRGLTSSRTFGARLALPIANGSRLLRQRANVTYADSGNDFTSLYGLSRSETRRIGVRTQTDIAWSSGLRLSGGLEAVGERALSTFITSGSASPLPVTRRIIGAFAEADVRSFDRVDLTTGLRVEHIRRDRLAGDPTAFQPRPGFDADTVVSVNPKVTAAFTLLDRASSGSRRGPAVSSVRVRVSAGTGIRPPDALEIAFTDNPGLKPERSRSAEAGIECGLAGGASFLGATAFFNSYDDLIVAVGPDFRDASRYRTDNISNAEARGVELSAQTRTRWGLDVRAHYTYLHTAILSVDRGAGRAPAPFSPGDALLRRPRHQGSIDLAFASGRTASFLQIGMRGRALDVEPTYGTFGGLFTNAGYTVVNAGTSVRLARALEVFARAANLLDRQYEETLGFPALGRHVMVGVRLAASR